MKIVDPFDDLLKNKLDNRDIVYEERLWEEAEMMLEKAMPEKKKKRPAFIYFIALFTLLTTGLVLYPYFNNSEKTQQTIQEKNSDTDADKKSPTTPMVVPSERHSQTIITNNNPSHETIANTTSGKTYQKQNFRPKQQPNIRATVNKESIPAWSNASYEKATTQLTNNKNTLPVNITDNKNDIPTQVSEAQHETASQLPPTIGTRATPALSDTTHSLTQTETTADSVSEKEKQNIAQNETTKPKDKTNAASSRPFELFAGFGYIGKFPFTASLINGGAGLILNYRITHAYRISTGLWYLQNSQINETKNYSGTSHGFGYTTTSLSISTQKTHNLRMPIELGISVGKNAEVMGTFQVDYLVNSFNTLTTSVKGNEGPATESERKGRGYKKGLTPWNFYTGLGYLYHINPRMVLYVQGWYGLTDLTKNNYYNNTRKNMGHGFMLGIRYKLVNF